jgi:hypothetical protein
MIGVENSAVQVHSSLPLPGETREGSSQETIMRLRAASVRPDDQLVLGRPILAPRSQSGLDLELGTGPGLLSGLLHRLAGRAGLLRQLLKTIQRHAVGYLLELVRSLGWFEERVLEVLVRAVKAERANVAAATTLGGVV